jgi:hypothetical protein
LTNIEHTMKGSFSLDAQIAPHISGGPIQPSRPRWDLINIHRGARFGEGDARILLRYLQTTDTMGNSYWATWTSQNPKSAPIFWAAVRDAVHLPRYDRLPEIFDAARVHRDPATLKSALDKIMLGLAVDEAKARIAANDTRAARRAATMGLTYGESSVLQSLVDGAP